MIYLKPLWWTPILGEIGNILLAATVMIPVVRFVCLMAPILVFFNLNWLKCFLDNVTILCVHENPMIATESMNLFLFCLK